jgi:hypothetical protein
VETAAGQGQVWLNGASLGTVSGDLSAADPYSQLWLYSEATGSVYFDDLTVANTYNGPLVPAVSFAPSSLTFGNVPFSTTSPAQTVTLKNTGTLALAIAGIAPGGPDAAQYAQTNTCPASLSVGARCSISVTFSPGVARATSASLQVTDNAPGSPQSVALSGTGTCAALFCDGFESGTLPGAWTGQTTTGTVATLGVVTSPVRSGAYALKVSLAKGSGDRNAYVTKTLAATPSAVYVKAWFNPQATGDFGEVNLVGLYDPNGKFLAWVYYDPSLTNLYLYDINYNLTTCTQQLPTGSWHSLELGDTGTQLTLSLDGTAICSMAETGLGSVASVRIGSDGSDNTLTQTIYVDDATIDTQPIP